MKKFFSLFVIFPPALLTAGVSWVIDAELNSASAQINFERTYGGTSNDRGSSVQQTSDGGYIIAGYTTSFGAGFEDVYLVKTDSLGDTLWTRTYGGANSDFGYSVQQTSDGGYIITGSTNSFGTGSYDVYLIKTDSFGDTLWTRIFGDTLGDYGYSVQQTSDVGYVIAGYTASFGSGGIDVYLIKTDPLGNTLWRITYGGANNDYGYSVQQTVPDGGYVIAGHTNSFGAGNDDVYLVKTDSLGDTLWTKTYGGTFWDYGSSVQQTVPDGGYVIAGGTNSFGAGTDVYLVKTDSLGDTLWTRNYGETNFDWGYSVQQTVPDGGYVIAGYTNSFGAGDDDVYLVKTDSLGDTLWTRIKGGTDYDEGYSVQQTVPDGGYIIAGWTSSFGAGFEDVYLIKTDSSGSFQYHDGGVISIDAPGDTVFTDSTYAPVVSVRNFGTFSETFELIATIDGYSDTVQVTSLPPGADTQISFNPWTVPSTDSSTYAMTVCTEVLNDADTTNDCAGKPIFAHEGQGPILLSAVASDNVNPVPGIDDDDQVLIIFDEPTNKPVIDETNINTVLALSGGHTWTDGFGMIGASLWNPIGDRLLITLSTTFSPPTVAVGDTIFPDGVTIFDKWGNPAVAEVVITGSFDPSPGVEEPESGEFRTPHSAFQLFQNHPNPFHSSTLIRYQIPQVGARRAVPVQLKIYDLTGRLVETLVDRPQMPGIYQLPISSNQLPGSGIYFYRLIVGVQNFEPLQDASSPYIATRKFILLK